MARTLGALLYQDFEVLDLFGPLEMFGNMSGKIDVLTVAEQAGAVRSAQGPRVHADHGFDDCPPLDLLLVPGGVGTRAEVQNERLISWLRTRAERLEVAMTVCTGTALLAQARAARRQACHDQQDVGTLLAQGTARWLGNLHGERQEAAPLPRAGSSRRQGSASAAA